MPTVDSKITKVSREEGSDWVTILLDHDRIKKLQTKMPQKAHEAAAFAHAGEFLRIKYTEKTGNINEYTGEPYINRYYEGAEPSTPPEAEIEVVRAPGRKTDPRDAWRMTLAAGAKLAVETLPLMKEGNRNFEAQKQVALAWAFWIFTTPPPAQEEPNENGSFTGPSFGNVDPGANLDAIPHGDEDIPF